MVRGSNLATDEDVYDDAYAEGYSSRSNDQCPYVDTWRSTAWHDGKSDRNKDEIVSDFVNITPGYIDE